MNHLNIKTKLNTIYDIPASKLAIHEKRVYDIVNKKAFNDIEKQKTLALNMANKITDTDKAYGRYLVSVNLNELHLADIFLKRFKDLTYTKNDWRAEEALKILEALKEEC